MQNISRRKFIVFTGVAGAAALAGLAGCSGGGEASSSASESSSESSSSSSSTSTSSSSVAEPLSVETDLASMTWDDILAEADGDTVTFLAWGSMGADPFVQAWWEHLAEDVKAKYNVTIEYADFDSAEYEKITTDIENGATATYDMFWYTGAMTAPIRAIDGAFGEDWVASLDNTVYLNPTNTYVLFDGAQETDAMEAPFQGLNPSLVYSTDLWDHALAYDAEEGGKRGLFHNFAELAEWVKINPGKFSYMDLTGAGSFHGLFFLKAILAELTTDGAGGWKPVYDESDDEDVRRAKIEANIDDWYDWSVSSEASEEAFYERASYLWAYLNELAPNLMQGDGAPFYVQTAPDMMQYVMAGDLACTFTTCTSVASRVAAAPESYMANPAIYMLQTSVGAWDYSIITSNSAHKAAAMVVANEMLDPEQQAFAFETTGNGYNVEYELLDSAQKDAFDEVVAEMGTLSPSVDEIALRSYTDKFGTVATWLASGWAQYVGNAS